MKRRQRAAAFCIRQGKTFRISKVVGDLQLRASWRKSFVDNAIAPRQKLTPVPCSSSPSPSFRVSAEAFQHLLDKRESRQAISTFFDNPSCRLIVFHLEEAPDDGDVAG
jgi:hypothetical protein